MNNIKEIILENIKMTEILDKYNIDRTRQMFCCPFHNDITPSAKAYKNSFFCFACGKCGDTIQFVQDYFNLNFKDAMDKINKDFNLNLNFRKISRDEFTKLEKEMELARQIKEKEKLIYRNKMLDLCNTSRILKKAYDDIKKQLTPYNWEEIEQTCAILTEQIELLDLEFERLNVKNH